MSTVTVLVATIPGRESMLEAAMQSVSNQHRQPDDVIIEKDPNRTGAARTRNRALAKVTTDYVAFLDDDDTLKRNHLKVLMREAELYPDAAVIYPTPEVIGMKDPTAVVIDGKWVLPWGYQWSEDHRQHMIQRGSFVPVTCLVKMDAIRLVGGFPEPGASEYSFTPCEDWMMFRRMALKNLPFRHVDVQTWRWVKGDWHTGGQGKSS